jgi:anti-sigma factor RsiW
MGGKSMLTPKNMHRASRILLAYLDGELPAEERCAIAEHLAGCAACRDELDSIEADLDWFLVLDAAARPAEMRPPAGGLSRLLAATRELRAAHPELTPAGAKQGSSTADPQAADSLENLLGGGAQEAAGDTKQVESLLSAFLGRRAASELMADLRRRVKTA